MKRPSSLFLATYASILSVVVPGIGYAGLSAAPAPEPDILTLIAAGSVAAALAIKLRKK